MNLRNVVVAFGLTAALVGCSAEEEGTYALTLEVRLADQGSELSFISPAGSVISHTTADVVGRPYYTATFEAGFSPGNDPAIHSEWGVFPESLSVDFTTPATYPPGAYDVTFVVYVGTEVEAGGDPVVAAGGDLATFTIDQTIVRDGDPTIIPGVVRFNVDGGDTTVRVENRTPDDAMDSSQFQAAMTNTIMIVP